MPRSILLSPRSFMRELEAAIGLWNLDLDVAAGPAGADAVPSAESGEFVADEADEPDDDEPPPLPPPAHEPHEPREPGRAAGSSADRVRPVSVGVVAGPLCPVLVAEIASGVHISFVALSESQSLAVDHTSGALENGEISLVVFRDGENDVEVSFLRWTDASHLKARRIALDHANRIKTIVAFRVKEITLQRDHMRIVVGQVPAFMPTRRAQGKQEMPEWCLQLMRWEHAKLYPGPCMPSAGNIQCVACVASLKLDGRVLNVGDDRSEYICGSCFSNWNHCCNVAVGGNADVFCDDGTFTCAVCLPTFLVP